MNCCYFGSVDSLASQEDAVEVEDVFAGCPQEVETDCGFELDADLCFALWEYGYEVDGDLAELDVPEEDVRVEVPCHVLGGQIA